MFRNMAVEWCIINPWSSSIILYNNTSIAQNITTILIIFPQICIFLHLYRYLATTARSEEGSLGTTGEEQNRQPNPLVDLSVSENARVMVTVPMMDTNGSVVAVLQVCLSYLILSYKGFLSLFTLYWCSVSCFMWSAALDLQLDLVFIYHIL